MLEILALPFNVLGHWYPLSGLSHFDPFRGQPYVGFPGITFGSLLWKKESCKQNLFFCRRLIVCAESPLVRPLQEISLLSTPIFHR